MSHLHDVKFLDLQRLNARYRQELVDAATRVIDSGWYVLGEEVGHFEREFADYCGAKHCVSVGNGLDALSIILKSYIALGRLNVGDKVLVPANTFIATVLAISEAGLVPVMHEPDEKTFNLAVQDLGSEVLRDVKAVMAVHLYGQLADVEGIKAVCDEHKLLFIEDAAQAHGAALHGRRAGLFGDAAGFSFFPGKNLGALGDAGAIVTNDDTLAHICKSLRSYGSSIKYHHDFQGMNSRLDEVQAAFLRVKLKYLDQEIVRRRQIARRYLSEINNDHLVLPSVACEEAHVWHLFVIRSQVRAELQAFLAKNGIQTLIHYPIAIPDQKAYAGLLPKSEVASRMAGEVLSLPVDPCMTDVEVDRVVDACNNFRLA